MVSHICVLHWFMVTIIFTPRSTKLKGGIQVSPCPSVSPSVRPSSVRLWKESCPLCIINNSSRILFIFTHLSIQLQKVCRVMKNSIIRIFGNFFKSTPLIFSCVHVMWMLKVLYCSNFKFSMMIPLDNLLNISYRFGQNCNSVFSAFFFQLHPFYTPVWKTGRIMPRQCPSVCPSVHPSVLPSVRPRFPDLSSTCF